MSLNTKNQQEYLNELITVFLTASRNKHLLHDFLKDLLTPSELSELALRWQIVKKLSAGVQQRAVVKGLGVGIATVTRGARMLANNNGGFNQILKRS